MRFKDLLGRSNKPELDSPGGRLLTTPGGPPPAASAPGTVPAPPPAIVDAPKPAAEPPKPAAVPVATTADLPVADAFERLLAVEQGELVPAPEPEPAAAGPLSDEEIDRIARRVAERIGSTQLAADIQRIVADVSERLVREEIQRIRQAAESRQP